MDIGFEEDPGGAVDLPPGTLLLLGAGICCDCLSGTKPEGWLEEVCCCIY